MKKLELHRIIIFLVFTFVITYAWTIFLIWPRVFGFKADALTEEDVAFRAALTAVLMFFPAIGVLFTRLVTGEGFKGTMLRLNLRGNARYYLMAWFGPMVLTLLGAIFYFVLFPSKFTFEQFCNFSSNGSAVVLTIVLLPFTPLFNLLPCLGEEWGWRGYLLSKVAARMKFLPAVLITGFIWGIWHAPIVVAGHNYDAEYPSLGIVAMCMFCIVVGVFLSFLTLRVKSCWPAVLAHGAINGTAGIGLLFSNNFIMYAPDCFIGPLPTGVVGGFAYMIVAVWIVLKMRKENI